MSHLEKYSFSECNGNAEIGWMTFELLDIKITLRNGKQPSKVEDLDVHCNLARDIESRLRMAAKWNDVVTDSLGFV